MTGDSTIEETIVYVKKADFRMKNVIVWWMLKINHHQPLRRLFRLFVNTLDHRPQTAINDKANGPSFFVSADFKRFIDEGVLLPGVGTLIIIKSIVL